MTTETSNPHLTGQCTGIRRELARYSVGGTERILFGQRVDGTTIRITDNPAAHARGRRSYVVDALDASEGYAAIQALVSDYLTQARRTRRIPATRITDAWVDDLADSFRYDRERATALQLDTATDAALALEHTGVGDHESPATLAAD